MEERDEQRGEGRTGIKTQSDDKPTPFACAVVVLSPFLLLLLLSFFFLSFFLGSGALLYVPSTPVSPALTLFVMAPLPLLLLQQRPHPPPA